MSRYMVIHNADYEKLASFENMVDIARRIAHSHGAEVAWLNSWWSAEDEVLICEWEAPDLETLQKLLNQEREYWPVARIYDVLWTDPKWYEVDS
jgi:hypothetical protein